jgi:polyamine oxidase
VHVANIELGANWIHGAGANNPLMDMAARLQLHTVLIPGGCANASGYELYGPKGKPLSRKIADRITHAFECMNNSALLREEDTSMGAALRDCGWSVKQPIDRALEWEITSADYINENLDSTSLQFELPDPTYSVLGADDQFVIDKRGYSSIVQQVAQDAKLTGPDTRVRFGVVVASISMITVNGMKCVRAETTDGRVFYGKHLISTLPLGVMQQHHQDIFKEPALPPSQVRALHAFTMGNFTKMFLQFKHNFWAHRGSQWLQAAYFGTETGGPYEFHDFGAYIPGFNTLFSYVVGRTANEWEPLSDEEAQERLMRRLRLAFSHENITIPEPSAFYMTRHGSDPLMRGAYSTVKLGITAANFTAMIQPLASAGEDGVFFAGEHTCGSFMGYVHGAYFSGLNAAHKVLDKLGLNATLSDRCSE